MKRRHWAHIVAAAVVAAAFAAATPAVAGTPAGNGEAPGETAAGPEAAATAYLEARAAAVSAADPAATLAAWVVPGSALARTEAQVATGTALHGRAGRSLATAACQVTVVDSRPGDDPESAVVVARAVTLLTWRSAKGATDVEGSGVDHTITLTHGEDGWVVTADAYEDVLKAARLEAAGAPRTRVRAAARAAERAGARMTLPRTTARAVEIPRRYSAIIKYDRPAAQAYADRYALSYNPTFVSFSGADCANFASQCARAGDMPQSRGTTSSGWWYDKAWTSTPWDDTYCLSWINCTRQIGYWNTRRTDWETSAGMLSRGDFIYYDWSGDGVWDHVAMVAGSNSAGQKVIDAHTTDLYRVYWKLGSSATKYRYAKVRAQLVV